MTAGKVPQSRKAKRKQEREEKKRQKYKKQRKEKDELSSSCSNVAAVRPKKFANAPRSRRIPNTFHEFLAKANNAESAVSKAEDNEIKALEAKLGLGSSSAGKSASAFKKLKMEFSKDGLGEDFADFLIELDNISEVIKSRPKMAAHTVAREFNCESEIGERKLGSSEVGDGLDMDIETRREMELLRVEDAEFLQGMEELPTDESETESVQFDSEEEESGDDHEAQANAIRNQQLTAIDSDDASDGYEGKGDRGCAVDRDKEDFYEGKKEDGRTISKKDKATEEKSNVVVDEDIYGRAVFKSRDGTKKSLAYLPPHLRPNLRIKAQAGPVTAASDSSQRNNQAMHELTRRINGQLNRLSESNMESILLEMEKLYRENGRSLVNEILFDKVLQITCHPRQVMTSLIKVSGALIAGLYHSVGSEVGGFFVEMLVCKLVDSVEEETKQLNESAETHDDDIDNDNGRTSKVPVNLALCVIMLYNFGVVHCTLVYDLFRVFVTNFSPTDIELIHHILKAGGAQLRSDDANALRQMVAAVQQKVNETQQANENKQPEKRIRFILDLIYDLKRSSKQLKGGNNSVTGALDLLHLKKWLGRVKSRCHNANNPLRVSLQELLNADEDGRWWIVGGTWVGYQRQQSASEETSDDGANESSRATDRLLKLAEKQHMNTDVRKKVFVALMGATDCFEAYERLVRLHLKEKQEREIVRVLLHCCGQETTFNRFYLVLADKLCEMDPRYKFTFQLAFWDLFKQMSSFKPRRVFNQAQMLAGLVLEGKLSLSCLKVLDFTRLDDKRSLFLRVLMEEILKVESELEMAQVFHRLLQTKKAQLTIDGLAVFCHQQFTSFRSEPDLTTRTLLKKRVKRVKSLLDQLAKTAALAEREAVDIKKVLREVTS